MGAGKAILLTDLVLASALGAFAAPEVVSTDRTKAELVFVGGSLAPLADKNPRIRFKLHCATLYSFWISPSERGESRGYVAAGGPAYPGLRDL